MSIDLKSMSDAELHELYKNILDVQNDRFRDEIRLKFADFAPFYGKMGDEYYAYVYEAFMYGNVILNKAVSICIENIKPSISIALDVCNANRYDQYTRIEKSEFVAKFGDAIKEFNNIVEWQ